MLNLSAAFNANTTTSATHERETAGGYVDGYYVPGATTTATIKASIQPLSAKEYQNLPEGIRNEASAKCITQFALQPGDRVIDGGDRYKVLSCDNWQKLGGYTRAVLGELR